MRAFDGYNVHEFRDPCVFRSPEDDVYHMSVTSHWHGSNALGHFTSSDLIHWKPATEPLMKDAPHFMECSDIFRMGKWWYAIYSSINDPRCVYYRYKEGSLYDPSGWSNPVALDGRSFYAAKTATNKSGKRYLCGWVQTLAGIYDSSGWGGALAVHELVQIDGGPHLACRVPEGVKNKYSQDVQLIEQKSEHCTHNDDTYSLTADSVRSYVQFNRLRSPMRITCTIERITDSCIFGFTFATSSDEQKAQHLRFLLEPENNNKADIAHDSDDKGQINWRSIADIRDARTYDITICIEHSVAVLYVNDRIAFSTRIYGMENNAWQVFCEKGSVSIHDLEIHTY